MRIQSLKSLRLENFKSFKATDIDFPATGLVCIKGPSGAGKTAILQALAHLLGYCDVSATGLQSRFFEDTLRVRGVFGLDSGDELVVSRLGSKLGIELNKQDGSAESIKASAAQYLELLQNYMGVTPELMAALTYKPQGQSSLFLNMTDSGKKEFLTKLLGLNKFEDAIEKTIKDHSKAEREFLELSVKASAIDDLMKDRTAPVLNLKNTEGYSKKITDLEIELIHKKQIFEQSTFLLAGIKEQNSLKIGELESELATSILSIKAKANVIADILQPKDEESVFHKLQAVQGAILKSNTEYQEVLSQLGSRLLRLNKAKELLERLAALVNSIKNPDPNLCPTCGQDWDGGDGGGYNPLTEIDKIKNEILVLGFDSDKIEEDLKTTNANIVLVKSTRPVADTFIKAENILRDELSAIRAFNNDLVNKQKQAKLLSLANQEREIADLKLAYGIKKNEIVTNAEIIELEEKIDLQLNVINSYKHELKSTQEQLSIFNKQNQDEQSRFDKASSEWKKMLGNQEAAHAEAKDKNIQMRKELDFWKLIGREGFLGAIFDETLSELTHETNNILIQCPNVEDVSVKFASQRETLSGKLKNEIKAVLSKSGEELPWNVFSGGQQRSIELAVDRAIAQIAQRRIGMIPGWLILDEAFDGLDRPNKEAVFYNLKQLSKNMLVLVIDHTSEFQELFDNIINVSIQERTSVIS